MSEIDAAREKAEELMVRSWRKLREVDDAVDAAKREITCCTWELVELLVAAAREPVGGGDV